MAIDPDELRALFLEEFQGHHATLQDGLLELERDPDAADRLLPELFRAAHTIKGGAQVVRLPRVAGLCHAMEEVLAELRDGSRSPSPDVVASLLAQLDRLAEVVAEHGGEPVEEDEPGPPPRVGASSPDPTPTTAAAPSLLQVRPARLDQLLDQAAAVLQARDRLTELVRQCREMAAAAEAVERRWRDVRPHATQLRPPRAAAAVTAAERAWQQAGARVQTVRAEAAATSRVLQEAATGLEHSAYTLRLQPLRLACEGLERAVRDLTHGDQERQAMVVVANGDVEMDSEVVAALRQPLLHLVRNAVAHGIEPVTQRRRVGKDDTGRVVVSAQVAGSQVVVQVSDDGAGFDLAALRARAEQRGLDVPSDDDAALRLAWTPGLSTAATADGLAGRGVGLDAVRSTVEQLGGTVELASSPGQGCTVTLHLPAALATLHAVIVSVGEETLALPSAPVRRIVRVPASAITTTAGGSHVGIDGDHARVVSLRAVLGLPARAWRPHETCLVLAGADGPAALVVDEVIAARQITRRQLHPRLEGAPGVLGTTPLPDGDAALVLNPLAGIRDHSTPAVAAAEEDATTTSAARVLVAEDSPAVRLMEQRILEQGGYDVRVAGDGDEAWRLLLDHGADLVVSDIEMPGKDGFALCQAIRAHPRFSDLPVVLVTSRASDEDRHRGLEAGANAYLVKGEFDPAALLDTVGRLL